MTNAAKVSIEVDGTGRGHVEVDGVRIPRVQSVTTRIVAGDQAEVALTLAIAGTAKVEYAAASLQIGGVVIPEALEISLWRYLAEKYGREIDVTTLESISREREVRGR
ncbi:hypothetical protein [Pandoraea bronchicola]|uniref:Uncharacterized protein n=1 Tax=Pandoraea bronchicola TaxID=2508287 RepID=A0A5E5BXT1_9BURK|nr:hypothetical protein [Pandoraea bronchicola]VVE90424.1 hypothetical protein PBR20603_04408 [Pandoraea bronchicola]